MRFPSNKYARALTLVLALQAVAFYALASRPEVVPPAAPLVLFPRVIGEWRTIQDRQIEPEILDVLKADDTLDRVYANAAGTKGVYFFMAYFKTQRAGQAPHSPKNCLPGSGWEPVESAYQAIPVAGLAQPIVTNRYVVRHGDEKSVVLYWYQGHNRVIASEYEAKLWLVADAIRYRRSDTAIVKVVVPVLGSDVEGAVRTGVSFIQAVYPSVQQQLPS
jgi:EpsI family protein